MTEQYNGWTNYETWNCVSWIDQDADYWIEEFKNHKNITSLADAIKSSFEYTAWEYFPSASLFSDLINAGLKKVNWIEIAKHYLPETHDDE